MRKWLMLPASAGPRTVLPEALGEVLLMRLQLKILLILSSGIIIFSAVVCKTIIRNVVHTGCVFCYAFVCLSHGEER